MDRPSLVGLISALTSTFFAPDISAQEAIRPLEEIECVTAPGGVCPDGRMCVIPDSFAGATEMDNNILEGNRLLQTAAQTSDPREKRARLNAAHAAFLAARDSIGAQCNPALLLRLGQVAGELGETKQAMTHLEPLLCAFFHKFKKPSECEPITDPYVRKGRELLQELQREPAPNFLLDVTPQNVTARLTSADGIDVPLPARVSDVGWRRLPPGEYTLSLSAPQHQDLSVSMDLRSGARFSLPLVLDRSDDCEPSFESDEAEPCPTHPADTFTPTVGLLFSARGLLRDVPSGGTTNLLATLLVQEWLAVEAGAELAPKSFGARAGLSVIYGESWFASLQVGGSVLTPTGDAAELGAKTLGGAHLGPRVGYGEARWAAFVDVTAEYFPKAGAPLAVLAGGGVQWRFWALQ